MKTQSLIKEYRISAKAYKILFLTTCVAVSVMIILPGAYDKIRTSMLGICMFVAGIRFAGQLPIWKKSEQLDIEEKSLDWCIGGKPALFLLASSILGLISYSFGPRDNEIIGLLGYTVWMVIMGMFASQQMKIWEKVEVAESAPVA